MRKLLIVMAAGVLMSSALVVAGQDAAKKTPFAVFTTSQGNFTVKLFEKDAPKTVANFIGLAEGTKVREGGSKATDGGGSPAGSPVARAAGIGGMVGGQMLDLAAEGRFDAAPAELSEQDVKVLQAMKTGALLRFGCLAGSILGKANPSQRAALEHYGSALGEAFQIADDLLDIEGDPATVGKATGKDAAAHKATLVGVLGPAAARRRLENLVSEAQAALSAFGSDADVLKAAARFVATRTA